MFKKAKGKEKETKTNKKPHHYSAEWKIKSVKCCIRSSKGRLCEVFFSFFPPNALSSNIGRCWQQGGDTRNEPPLPFAHRDSSKSTTAGGPSPSSSTQPNPLRLNAHRGAAGALQRARTAGGRTPARQQVPVPRSRGRRPAWSPRTPPVPPGPPVQLWLRASQRRRPQVPAESRGRNRGLRSGGRWGDLLPSRIARGG